MNFKKNGNLAHIGGTVVEDNIIYSGITKEWLINHGWEPIIDSTSDLLISSDMLIAKIKDKLLYEIKLFDESSSVNGFFLNNELMWLPKADRVGLVNAINASKALGNEIITIGLGGNSYTTNCDIALQMLYSLELYALLCYNVTLLHLLYIKNCNSLKDLQSYDITKDYPGKLIFNIS